MLRILFAITLLLTCLAHLAHANITDDVLRQYPSADMEMLVVDEQQVATFFHPSHLALSRGALIVFADGLTITLENANRMAEHFNTYGWATLVVMVELPQENPPEKKNDDSFSPTEFAAYQSQLHATVDATRLNDLIRLLLPQMLNMSRLPRGYRLLLAEGITAAHLLRLDNMEGIDGLVCINTFWPEQSNNQRIIQDIATTPIPLLDLALSHSNRWHSATQKDRRREANRQRKSQYRQRTLTTIDEVHAVPIVVTEVIDWIRAQGW